jgi:branched-chain amino acid transport system permease protein
MNWKTPALTGLYAGIVAIYVCLVGITESFAERNIIADVISLAYAFLLLIVLAAGFLAASRVKRLLNPEHIEEDIPISTRQALLGGLLTGLIIGAFLADLAFFTHTFPDWRDVMVNMSPTLVEILTFGQESFWAGAILLVVLSTLLGGLGGYVFIINKTSRRAIIWGFVMVVFLGTLSEIIRVTMLRPFFPSFIRTFLVTSNGLTIAGAVLIALITVAIVLRGKNVTGAFGQRVSKMSESGQRNVRITQVVLLGVLLIALPWIVGTFPSEVLVNIGIFVIMGFGINIVVGMSGMLDLGYVAFFAVGSYAAALLTTLDAEVGGIGLSFWAALPIIVIVTGIAGLLVGAPVLRLRGDYLAIVTLGFGEIARFLALSDWFKPWLGGAQGIIKIPNISVMGLELTRPEHLYYLFLIGSLLAWFISYRIKDARVGRAWIAMREDEDVAETMGINTTYYKLLAFALGAMIASVSGAIFAAKLGTIFPHSFRVEVSITALSLLIVGGIGSLPGVVVGAAVLVGLPELLREFSEFRLLFYGILLIVMMLLKPEGLLPSRRRKIELVEDDRAQDAWFDNAKDAAEAAASGTD